mgnify:CR=1 FL=1
MHYHRLTPSMILTLALTSGCAWWGPEPGQVQVQSDPPGADVYVMGEKVGVTPISVPQEVIVPVTYPAAKQDLYGTVTLRKAGCADSVRRVSTGAVSRGIHAKLECQDASGGVAPGGGARLAPQLLEERLRRLKDLQDKGLITDEDAAEARRRMLGEL